MKELSARECDAVSGSGIGPGFGIFPFVIGKFIGGMIKIPF